MPLELQLYPFDDQCIASIGVYLVDRHGEREIVQWDNEQLRLTEQFSWNERRFCWLLDHGIAEAWQTGKLIEFRLSLAVPMEQIKQWNMAKAFKFREEAYAELGLKMNQFEDKWRHRGDGNFRVYCDNGKYFTVFKEVLQENSNKLRHYLEGRLDIDSEFIHVHLLFEVMHMGHSRRIRNRSRDELGAIGDLARDLDIEHVMAPFDLRAMQLLDEFAEYANVDETFEWLVFCLKHALVRTAEQCVALLADRLHDDFVEMYNGLRSTKVWHREAFAFLKQAQVMETIDEYATEINRIRRSLIIEIA